jgi:hypothetical protein
MGLLLVLTGLGEILEPFMDAVPGNEASVGSHHGITLYGSYTFLPSIGKVKSGLSEVHQGHHKLHGRHGEAEPSVARGE